jgi:Mce-associated membrane protein
VRVIGAIGAVLLIVLAVTTVLQGNRASDLRSKAHDRTAAERVAGEFAEALFTFQSAKPTANLDRLKELATTSYKPRVDAARKVAVTDQVSGKQELTSTTHVTDVYLTEIDSDSAHAVTRGSWEVSSGSERAALALYLRIDLKKQHGQWKVDSANGVTARPAASDTSSPTPAPTSSTSTTGPTSTSTSTTVSR